MGESGRKKKENLAEAIEEKGHRAVEAKCSEDPLHWLCNATRTRDDHWKEHGGEPHAKFPMMPYFPFLMHELQKPGVLLISKSRDMRITWLVCGYLVWVAQFHGPVHIMIQTQKEDKARDLVSGIEVPGYVRTLYEYQEAWMRDMHPTTKPSTEMAGLMFSWKNGSRIQGIPSGPDQIRQYDPEIVFFDEAAYLEDFLGSFGAAQPVARQIIAVSSAAPSAFGDMVLKMEEECPPLEYD